MCYFTNSKQWIVCFCVRFLFVYLLYVTGYWCVSCMCYGVDRSVGNVRMASLCRLYIVTISTGVKKIAV